MNEAMHLEQHEAAAMAWALVQMQCQDAAEWVLWEDVPELDEVSYDLLVDCILSIGRGTCAELLRSWKATTGADGDELLRRAR